MSYKEKVDMTSHYNKPLLSLIHTHTHTHTHTQYIYILVQIYVYQVPQFVFLTRIIIAFGDVFMKCENYRPKEKT